MAPPLNMTEPWLALDIDGVLARTDKEVKHFIGIELGFPFGAYHQPAEHYDLSLDFPEAVQTKAWSLMKQAYATDEHGFYRKAEVFPFSLGVVEVLSYEFNLVYLTSRPTCVKGVTKEWLHNNRFPTAPVVCDPDKVSFCHRHGIKYLVEDNPTEAVVAASEKINTFLVARAYNELISYESPYLVRDDFREAPRVMRQFKEKER